MRLPKWMRVALWATTAMNVAGAVAFSPLMSGGRELASLPDRAHPIYLWIIAEFIFLFGVAYGWCAFTGRAPRMVIALGAAGKLAFFATLLGAWLAGQVPFAAALGGVGDLVFGSLFLFWLYQVRNQPEAR